MTFPESQEVPEADSWFSCRRCGECCRGYGGTFVGDEDIRRIAAFIGVDPSGFVRRFCRMSGGKPLLAQQENGYCIFWDQVCTIHPVKPRMCREWPFIDGLLADPANWKIMAASCPGIREDAPIHQVQSFIRRLRENHDRRS